MRIFDTHKRAEKATAAMLRHLPPEKHDVRTVPVDPARPRFGHTTFVNPEPGMYARVYTDPRGTPELEGWVREVAYVASEGDDAITLRHVKIHALDGAKIFHATYSAGATFTEVAYFEEAYIEFDAFTTRNPQYWDLQEALWTVRMNRYLCCKKGWELTILGCLLENEPSQRATFMLVPIVEHPSNPMEIFEHFQWPVPWGPGKFTQGEFRSRGIFFAFKGVDRVAHFRLSTLPPESNEEE